MRPYIIRCHCISQDIWKGTKQWMLFLYVFFPHCTDEVAHTFVPTDRIFPGTEFTFLHHAGTASSSFQRCTLLKNQEDDKHTECARRSRELLCPLPPTSHTAIYPRPRHSFHISAGQNTKALRQ